MLTLTKADFEATRARIAPHIHHTPLLSSRQLSERTGFEGAELRYAGLVRDAMRRSRSAT